MNVGSFQACLRAKSCGYSCYVKNALPLWAFSLLFCNTNSKTGNLCLFNVLKTLTTSSCQMQCKTEVRCACFYAPKSCFVGVSLTCFPESYFSRKHAANFEAFFCAYFGILITFWSLTNMISYFINFIVKNIFNFVLFQGLKVYIFGRFLSSPSHALFASKYKFLHVCS